MDTEGTVRGTLGRMGALFPVVLVVVLALTASVWADIAPPEQPPGSNISPGEETQVAMSSERVVLEVQPGEGENTTARVTADFNMRNTGTAPETMQVRFPLADPDGRGNGMGDFPEVQNFAVSAGGAPLATTVITTPNPRPGDEPIRWAAFDVTFPPGQDLRVNVTYALTATGYPPLAQFSYVLETGAGWNGPIGTADVVVKLPYAATGENVFVGEGKTSPGGTMVGDEVRWHLENLEPKPEDNIFITILAPYAWQRITGARQKVIDEPNNPENLIALAQAYQGAITSRFPSDEGDPFAARAEETMGQATAQQPNSARTHAMYARIIWENLSPMATLPADDPNIKRVLAELGAALQIEPDNAEAKALLAEITPSVSGNIVLPTMEAAPTRSGGGTTPGAATPAIGAPTAVELPTADLPVSTPGVPTPAPEDTPIAPASPNIVRPTNTAGSDVTGTAVPPSRPSGSDDGNLPLTLMLIALPFAIGAIAYAVVITRRRSGA